jgi:hypothetical protein
MTWYWILLIIFGYFIVGAIIAGFEIRLFSKKKTMFTDNDDNDMDGPVVFTIILWPLVLIFFVLALIVEFVAFGGKHDDENEKKETKEGLKDL